MCNEIAAEAEAEAACADERADLGPSAASSSAASPAASTPEIRSRRLKKKAIQRTESISPPPCSWDDQ